jgi:hypothetical protein
MIKVTFSARKQISFRHPEPSISRTHLDLKWISGVAFQWLEWPGREGMTTQLYLPQRLRISRTLPLLHRNNLLGILSRLCTGRTRNGGLLPGGDKRVTTDSGGSCASCSMEIGRQFPGSGRMYRKKITENEAVHHCQTIRMNPHNFRN